uniref:B cell linker n=1 Tax=Strigops habroptila TaxID=2489341 RepID=A0A672VEA3_STRHB
CIKDNKIMPKSSLQKMVHDMKKNESGIINKFKNPPVFHKKC